MTKLKNKVGCKINGKFTEKELQELKDSGFSIIEEEKKEIKTYLKIKKVGENIY